MMCHSLISYPGVCLLDVYVSFPGMMQDDKGNIKVNLGITLVQWLTGIYHGIGIFCLCTNTALYNIPIGFKIFPIAFLQQRNDTFSRFTVGSEVYIKSDMKGDT